MFGVSLSDLPNELPYIRTSEFYLKEILTQGHPVSPFAPHLSKQVSEDLLVIELLGHWLNRVIDARELALTKT